jgi:tetratricopeptide (TPR) repeat protein
MRSAHAIPLPLHLVAVLGIALAVAGCGNSHSRFLSHMERGKQYLAADNLDKASIEFRNALQIEPRNVEAFYFNGKVAERRGGLREAVGYYQAAIDAQPSDSRSRAALAKIFVLGGAPQRALEVISPGLLDRSDDPDLLAARAAARHELKDDTEAREDAEKAVRIAPGNENAIGVLAALALRAGDTERAVSLVSDAVERVPDSIDLRRILGSIYLSTGQPGKAEEQMRKIIALEPREMSPRIELARHFAQAHELDAAQQVLEQAVRDFPGNDTAKLTLIEFINTQRSPEQGERILRAFISREPDNEDLRLALGAARQRAGVPQEAVAIYREVIRRAGTGSKGLVARDRIAAIQISAGQYEQAKQLIAAVLEESPRDDDALIMRANIALAQNDPGDAVVDLRSVLHDQPKSAVLHRSLARAYVAKGEPALAEETLRSLLDSGTDDLGVRIDLSQVLLQTDRPAQAVLLLEETAKRVPQDPQVSMALVRAYLADRNLSQARAAAEGLKARYPDSANGYYLAGLVAHEEKRADDAQKNLERALELEPTSSDALTALTRYSLERGHAAVAITRLQSALEHDPKNVEFMFLLGGAYLEMKDLARATDVLTRAIALSPRSWLAHRDLGQVRVAAGDLQGALQEYRTAFELAPTQPRVVMELAPLYEKQGRVDAAIACYEALYKGDSNGRRIAANNLAMLLVTYKADQVSLDRARALTASFDLATDASLLDTAGWVRFKRREYRDAVPLLERAADRAPDSKVIRYHLGMAQLRLGQRERARANLETALSGAGTFAGAEEARSVLASLRAAPRSG